MIEKRDLQSSLPKQRACELFSFQNKLLPETLNRVLLDVHPTISESKFNEAVLVLSSIYFFQSKPLLKAD